MAPKKKCFVPGCCNTEENKIMLNVPRNVEKRKVWYEAVGLPTSNIVKTDRYACEDHFELETDAANWIFYKTVGEKLFLADSAIPRLCDPKSPTTSQLTDSAKKRKTENLRTIKESSVKRQCIGEPSNVDESEDETLAIPIHCYPVVESDEINVENVYEEHLEPVTSPFSTTREFVNLSATSDEDETLNEPLQPILTGSSVETAEVRSSTEDGDLIIDMTLSDDEDPTSLTEKANEAVNLLTPEISLEVPEVNAYVATALAAPSTPAEPLPCLANPLLGSLLKDCPSADVSVTQQGLADQIKNPNLWGILGNYTPSELARVTTQSLIECIAKFPALWDSKEPSHYNHKYCGLLWKNIALVLRMQVKRARSKWYSLRSAYRKEFFKSKASGIPSRFAYFQALSFLEEETLREKERGDVEKSKLLNFFAKRKSIPDGLNGTSINLDDDDDCMIVENLEDCSEGTTTATASETPSTKGTVKASEVNNRPDVTRSESNMTPQPVNGTAFGGEQARPVFLIRPKNISELMPVPSPVPLELASTSDAVARSSSPEVVFLSKKSPTQEAPKIVVSNAFPASLNDSTSVNSPSPYALFKTNLEDEMRSSAQKVVNKNPHHPPKKNKCKSKIQKMVNGSASIADATAMKFLKEPHGLPMIGNETPGPSKKLNGTVPGKRVSEIVASISKVTKKPRLSSSESCKGNDRPRDGRELTEVNKGFLVSLLPDVEGMTNAQFRTFKKQATALVSMILDR